MTHRNGRHHLFYVVSPSNKAGTSSIGGAGGDGDASSSSGGGGDSGGGGSDGSSGGWDDFAELSRFEAPAVDFRKLLPDVVGELAAKLPAAHQTASNPHSTHPSQSAGYTWLGCRLSATPPAPPAPPAPPTAFKGCYVDKSSTGGKSDPLQWDPVRDLQLNTGSSAVMTAALCIKRCSQGNATRSKPFKYAGLQAGQFCLCGDSYGRYE